MRNKFNLEAQVYNQLIKLKDDCWINEELNSEGIEKYAAKVKQFKDAGYDVGIHELVLEQLYERLEKANIYK